MPTYAVRRPSWSGWVWPGSTSTSRSATSRCRSCACSTWPGPLAFDPLVLLLDEITAALPPDLSEVVFAVMRRWRERGRSVLFISHRLAEVRAHCDMCTVLRDGREVASFIPGRGRRGPDRQGDARRGGGGGHGPGQARAASARRRRDASAGGPRAGRRTCARGRLAWRSATARCSASSRSKARVRTCCSTRCAETGGPTPASSSSTARHCAAAIPTTPSAAASCWCRATGCTALLPQRPIRENIAAPLYNRVRSWGSINPRRERRRGGQRRATAVDRHPRRGPGQAAVRRQPAEGHHRPLAGDRLPDAAAVRPDPGHRRRHQAADLRPRPRAGRRRRRRS